MVNFFDRYYSSIQNKNSLLVKLKYYSALRFLIRFSANIIIPIYFRITQNNSAYKLHKSLKSNRRIVVSLTSFPIRINKLWIVIESILRQDYKPDKIILWLSKEQFPNFDLLPKTLISLMSKAFASRERVFFA